MQQKIFTIRLKIPFIELRRLYQTDKIDSQYQALASVLGREISRQKMREKQAEYAVEDIQTKETGRCICSGRVHER